MLRSCFAARTWISVLLTAGLAACTAAGPAAPLGTGTSNAAATEGPHPFAGDASWIAYHTGSTTRLIHPDGADDRQIAHFSAELIIPNWSPDGQRLVMTSRGTGGREPLYEYELATETFRQLFACDDQCLGDDEPVYSPDGSKVAFVRALGPFDIENDRPADCGLWVGEVSTGQVEQLTSNDGCDREYFPRWSPDGSQLTYWRWREESGETVGTAIFVIGADGDEERQLTDWEMFAGDPDWSPDGEWIVFGTHPFQAFPPATTSSPTESNVYRIRPDGSSVEQLTEFDPAADRAGYPRYTPQGDQILFALQTTTGRELAVMPADGGERVTLARSTEDGWFRGPSWQP